MAGDALILASSEKTGDRSNVEPLRKTRPCPECGRPSSRADYPFCSARCRNIDLNRWLSGSYAIPVSEDDENREESDRRNPEDGGSRTTRN